MKLEVKINQTVTVELPDIECNFPKGSPEWSELTLDWLADNECLLEEKVQEKIKVSVDDIEEVSVWN